MGKTYRRSYYVNVVCIICILGAFSIASIVLVNMGGQLYWSTLGNNAASNKVREALSQVSEKVRGMDMEGGIRVEKREGIDTLVMEEGERKDKHETIIYFKDGALYEVYRQIGTDVWQQKDRLVDGITQIESFMMKELNGNMIQLCVAEKDGHEETVVLMVRSRR